MSKIVCGTGGEGRQCAREASHRRASHHGPAWAQPRHAAGCRGPVCSRRQTCARPAAPPTACTGRAVSAGTAPTGVGSAECAAETVAARAKTKASAPKRRGSTAGTSAPAASAGHRPGARVVYIASRVCGRSVCRPAAAATGRRAKRLSVEPENPASNGWRKSVGAAAGDLGTPSGGRRRAQAPPDMPAADHQAPAPRSGRSPRGGRARIAAAPQTRTDQLINSPRGMWAGREGTGARQRQRTEQHGGLAGWSGWRRGAGAAGELDSTTQQQAKQGARWGDATSHKTDSPGRPAPRPGVPPKPAGQRRGRCPPQARAVQRRPTLSTCGRGGRQRRATKAPSPATTGLSSPHGAVAAAAAMRWLREATQPPLLCKRRARRRPRSVPAHCAGPRAPGRASHQATHLNTEFVRGLERWG